MEHWLPLLEERLDTLFDHLGENDLILRDADADKALEARREAIDDYYQNRVRAMESRAGQLSPARARRALSCRTRNGPASSPSGRSTSPRPSPSPESERIIDFGVEAARDFAPERAQQANVYEAVAAHVAALRKAGRKVVLASYTKGARERLSGLLEDHGLKAQKLADNWQDALGRQDPAGPARPAARPRLHDARRRRPHRAGHARRPAGPPPQEAQGDRGLPRRACDAVARRPRGSRRPWHRPLRGPDPDSGQQGPARLRRARICARQQALRPGREYRAADPLRQRERGRDPRQPRRRGLAAAQVQDEGADPRDRGRAHQDRRAARDPRRRGRRARRQLPAVRRPLPL